MGTQVRDAMVLALSKAGGEKFASGEELAKRAGVDASGANSALRLLTKKGIAKRQREGKSFLYAAGPKIGFGLKYAGRKFPFQRKESVNGEAVPAAAGMAGIVIRIEGQAHAITLAEAKQLYSELKTLFG